MPKRIVGDDLRRFLSRVQVKASGCHEWGGATDGHGYGHLWLQGRIVKAHRASWILQRGAIPAGLWVLHKCDNPPCVNPDHLFLGDRTDNMRDMAAKGRQVFQASPEKIKRGARAHRAKLTEAQVLAIIGLIREGRTHKSIGAEYGVSTPAISAIASRRNWAHLYHGIDKDNPRAEFLVMELEE